MTVLAVTASLVAALCLGYRLGLRAGRRTPTWRQRTTPVALVTQATRLVTLLAAVRLERSVRRRLSGRRTARSPWR